MRRLLFGVLLAIGALSGHQFAYAFSQYVDGTTVPPPHSYNCWYFDTEDNRFKSIPVAADTSRDALRICMEHQAASQAEDPDHEDLLPVAQARR